MNIDKVGHCIEFTLFDYQKSFLTLILYTLLVLRMSVSLGRVGVKLPLEMYNSFKLTIDLSNLLEMTLKISEMRFLWVNIIAQFCLE